MVKGDIIKRVLVSEKGTLLAEKNQFALEVDSSANKSEIGKAVEKAFGVHVLAVVRPDLRAHVGGDDEPDEERGQDERHAVQERRGPHQHAPLDDGRPLRDDDVDGEALHDAPLPEIGRAHV